MISDNDKRTTTNVNSSLFQISVSCDCSIRCAAKSLAFLDNFLLYARVEINEIVFLLPRAVVYACKMLIKTERVKADETVGFKEVGR